MTEETTWRVPVVSWSAWNSLTAQTNIAQDVTFVEPLLRRRLSPLARAAMHVANVCTQGQSSVHFVYASRHGELERTVDLLRDLARNEAPSPSAFSLSVLNSVAGVFAIARGDHAATTAVSAGTETFGFGLLEAVVRARRTPNTPVLYVYADAPAPDPFRRQTCDPDGIFALGMLIKDSAGDAIETTMIHASAPASTESQAHHCLRALTGKAASWSSGNRQWHWQRR